MYAELRNQPTKMNKTCQDSMFIRYPTILKIREVVQLKDDIKKSLPGNTVEVTVIFQQKGIKANPTRQPVLVVVIIILENRARQKRSNAITARKSDTSRNIAG